MVTRRRIADAARARFAQAGYAATTLAAIATEAGVAVQTVYAVYGSKRGILHALRETAMLQPEAEELYAQAMAAPNADERLERFASSIRRRWETSADIVAIHRDAAGVDPEIRAGVARTLERRRGGLHALAAALEGEYRPGVNRARAAALLDLLTMPEGYLELISVHGWTPDEYERWLAATLARELLGRPGSAALPNGIGESDE
jgi:AcrR family transcriptional regulator